MTMLVFLFSLPHKSVTIAVATVLIVLLLGGSLLVQMNYRRRLHNEMNVIGDISQHNVELEMVLKAMKLCTWRIDVHTKTLTMESDFRDLADVYNTSPNIPLDRLTDHIVAWDEDRIANSLNDLCEGRKDSYHEIYEMKLPITGKSYWEETYATVADREADGKPKTIIGTTMTINKRKRMEQELIDARNRAEESDRLKSAFLQNISHEVRTPLNSIVGFSEVLSTLDNQEEKDKLVAIIKKNTDKLVSIFDNIVKISNAEALGKGEVVKENFSINQLLRDIADRYAKQNTNVKLNIFKRRIGKEIYLHNDREKVDVVVEHFVSNAVKFTTEGEIEIGCKQLSPTKVRVYVRDTGVGISPEDRERIFDRFVKLDHFTDGTGLGLSVCRTYAQAIGGTIGVDSELGKGSTFWLEL